MADDLPQLRYYRYRVMYRHTLKDWIYCETAWTDPWDVLQDEIGEELADRFSRESPDGFRKVEVELVEEPPKDWLEKRIEELRKAAKWRMRMADAMEAQLHG